jgi:hypothetical protein
MRRALSGRIEKLESVVPTPSPPKQLSKEEMDRALRSVRTIAYSDWCHHGLSLEQLLAFARDDGAHAQANPQSTSSPGLLQEASGVWVHFWPAVSAREFEIQILERDEKVDAETAQSLRRNIRERFFADTGPVTESRYGATLTPLPHPVEFDEAAALKAARQQCPLDGSLPLEKELQLREDHLHEIRQRDLTPGPYGTFEKISDESDAYFGHDTYAQTIAKLKEKIAECDRRQPLQLTEKTS